MAITTVGTDGDDRVIEFLVAHRHGPETCGFAIFREHGEGWEHARLAIDPDSGSVPVAAVEWAVEFAREYL
ncbi:hypothetical protein ACFWUZ_31765 [Streptomyces sp. NPDC058646]|uniref:hypothetical protein n=1 Tax=Streptomyces sp. NPDC058646 TaxID=3346574 RepID=UPI00366245EE